MYSREEKEKIISLYQNGKSGLDIAKELKHGKNHVYNILKEFNIKLDKRDKIDNAQKQIIVDRYQAGEDIKVLAKDFNVTKHTIRLILNKAQVELRWGRKIIAQDIEEKIIELWHQNCYKYEIADLVNLPIKQICKILTKNNIYHNQKNSRENHGNWKGGKFTSTSGYIYIKLDEDDEYFCMTDDDGYVAEHRYNLAKSFGRPLTKNETVHHIDGNRKNNDISNLQLRQGKHGKGQQFQCCDCGSHNVKSIQI